MGFCMTCSNTGISCCYSTWSSIRIGILKITIKYLKEKFIEVQKEIDRIIDNEKEDEEYINGYSTHNYNMFITDINEKFIQPIEKIKDDDIISVMTIFKLVSSDYIFYIKDALASFGVYGIYTLFRQGDCDGVYTIGESYDILELLKNIKPCFDKDSEVYNQVYLKSDYRSSIYDIFYASITSSEMVYIT